MAINGLPFVSVVVPCRNEEAFISKCLDSLIANDYPKDRTEILVIDGMSQDSTRSIIKEYENRYHYIRVFDNPKKILAAAWNIGIKNSKGDVIMTMNSHSVFKDNYISNCLKHLKNYNADYVGGVINTLPRNNTYLDKAIAIALSHAFGVGNSYFRIGVKSPIWTDTAAFGGYRKEIFQRVGLYNEELTRSQDMEFHLRLKRSGIKILLAPDMACDYYTRSNFKDFYKDSFINGFWVLYPLKFASVAVSWRHIIPAVFVTSLIASIIISMISDFFMRIFLFIIILYAAVNFYFSFRIALKEKKVRYFFLMPIIFALLHIRYGLGTCYGGIKVLTSKRFWKQSGHNNNENRTLQTL